MKYKIKYIASRDKQTAPTDAPVGAVVCVQLYLEFAEDAEPLLMWLSREVPGVDLAFKHTSPGIRPYFVERSPQPDSDMVDHSL